jgi:hypothetical protein
VKLRQLEIAEAGGGDHGELDGTNSVELVPAPAAGFVRVVDSIRMTNIDSAAVTIRVRKTVTGPVDWEFDSAIALAADGKFDPVDGDHVIRLAEDESITAIMAGAAATTDPTWVSSWVDVPEPV